MPFVSLTKDTWTTVVTTSSDTLVQNRSPNPIYVTTESTSGLAFDEALEVPKGAAVQIATGKTVSAASVKVGGKVFYMGV